MLDNVTGNVNLLPVSYTHLPSKIGSFKPTFFSSKAALPVTILKVEPVSYTHLGGTASYFAGLPKPIAGKTGTAENSHGRDHGLFVAYGPVDDPELVVVCIVEQGGFGSIAAGDVYKRQNHSGD